MSPGVRRYHLAMQTAAPQQRDVVTWDELDTLVAGLAARLRSEQFDLLLAITRGGLVPAGMLAYRLGIRNILGAAVEFYDEAGQPGPHPTFLQFPADPLLRGQRILVVDEVWDSGTTIHAVIERIRQAGGLPTTAVLHWKPTHSVVPGAPDVHAVTTDAWVVYPFKAGG
jgi:hypoxanthine phosphoribosyltransferase